VALRSLVGQAGPSRDRVLERIDRRGAPFVVFLAPAGYRKTVIARKAAAENAHSLYIRCEEANDFRDGLAELVGAAGLGTQDVLIAWSRHEDTALTIDNIECLKTQPESIELLRALLNAPSGGNRILFCGRMDPGVEFSARADPHNITFLRCEQLAFDQAEMRELFSGTGVDDALRYRLHLFTGGWPAAALYCAQSARAGDVDELIDLPATSFADFLDYIEANLTSQLPEHVLCALSTVVAIPGLRALEATRLYAARHPDIVGELTRVFEVASLTETGALKVNPLLRFAVLKRHRDRVASAQRFFGDVCVQREEYGRAAQVYLAAGDASKAQEILERGRLAHASFDSFSPLPETEPVADLLSRPALWAAILGARRLSEHPDVLANEARTVLDGLNETTDPSVAMSVRSLSAIAFMDAGMIDEAAAVVDFETHISANSDVRSTLPILASRAMLDSYLGKHERALATLQQIRPYALYNPTVFAQLTCIEVRAARERGQWEVEHHQLRRMLHAAEESRSVTVIAMALAEGIFGSWLAHESEHFDDYVTQLASLMREHELPSLLNFQLASLGLQPTHKRMSKCWDSAAFLIASVSEPDPVRASELAETAYALSDASGAIFMRILARVAVSEKVSGKRQAMFDEALALAAPDSIALALSLKQVSVGRPPFGMLAPFFARLRVHSQESRPRAQIDLKIGLGDAVVRRADVPISISEGGWGLLLSLALQRRPVHRDVLCDRLWPAMSLEAGYNALKMCVRRTRLQLESPDAIVSTQGGYALADWVRVDLAEIEQLEAAIGAGSLKSESLPVVRAYFNGMRHGRPANFASLEWFSATEQRLESICRRFGEFLAQSAIHGKDYPAALEIAEYLIALDPLDESARKLKIMAHVAANDAATAKRELRQYAKILKQELDVEPSRELIALIK
jgi:DNA-binding SARP family transcriptional activator